MNTLPNFSGSSLYFSSSCWKVLNQRSNNYDHKLALYGLSHNLLNVPEKSEKTTSIADPGAQPQHHIYSRVILYIYPGRFCGMYCPLKV